MGVYDEILKASQAGQSIGGSLQGIADLIGDSPQVRRQKAYQQQLMDLKRQQQLEDIARARGFQVEDMGTKRAQDIEDLKAQYAFQAMKDPSMGLVVGDIPGPIGRQTGIPGLSFIPAQREAELKRMQDEKTLLERTGVSVMTGDQPAMGDIGTDRIFRPWMTQKAPATPEIQLPPQVIPQTIPEPQIAPQANIPAISDFDLQGMGRSAQDLGGTTLPGGVIPAKPAEMEVVSPIPKYGAGGVAGQRPMTQGQAVAAITRASRYGVNPNNFRDANGNIDWEKTAIASGFAERQARDAERQAKLDAIPEGQKTKAAGYIALQGDMDNLKETIQNIQASGNAPGLVDDAIAAATAAPASGFFSTFYQRGLKSFQSEKSRELEGAKAMVATALTNAISGAAVPEHERKYLTPFIPVAGDSLQVVIKKAADLEQYLNRKVQSYSMPVSKSVDQKSTDEGSSQPTGKAGERAGKIKIIAPDGVEGYWDENKPIPKGFKLSQ